MSKKQKAELQGTTSIILSRAFNTKTTESGSVEIYLGKQLVGEVFNSDTRKILAE